MCELLLGRFNKQHLRFPGFLTNLALLLIWQYVTGNFFKYTVHIQYKIIKRVSRFYALAHQGHRWSQNSSDHHGGFQSCLIASDAYMIISWQPGIVPSGNANTTVCWSFCISLCMPTSKSNELLDYMVPITLHKASLDLYFKWLLT